MDKKSRSWTLAKSKKMSKEYRDWGFVESSRAEGMHRMPSFVG